MLYFTNNDVCVVYLTLGWPQHRVNMEIGCSFFQTGNLPKILKIWFAQEINPECNCDQDKTIRILFNRYYILVVTA